MIPVTKYRLDKDYWHKHVVEISSKESYRTHQKHKLRLFQNEDELNEKKEFAIKRAKEVSIARYYMMKKEDEQRQRNLSKLLNVIS